MRKIITKNKQKSDKIERMCYFCEYSEDISDEENVLCHKRGMVWTGHLCRRFIYDPLKRNVKRLPPLPHLADLFEDVDG